MGAQAAGLDNGYLDFALDTHTFVQEALAAFNSSLAIPLPADQALSKRQQALTQLLDKHSWEQHLASAPPIFQATLRSDAEPGAQAFLAAFCGETPPGGPRLSQR